MSLASEIVSRIFPELRFSAVRSRGPGGQNVNKVSSAAILYWDYANSPALTPEQKQSVCERLKNHISKDGTLYLRSDELRDLERNKDRCVAKLSALLERAFHRPKPRRKTKLPGAARRRRRQSKERRSEIKRLRQRVSAD